MNKKAFLPLIFLLAVSLCSCGLLPKEDEPMSPPVLKKYDPAQYNTYRVTRGDIQKVVTISVSYVHAVTETLSFPVGGVTLVNIFVNKGDQVKKGDILAALDTSDLDGQLKEVRYQLASVKTAIENIGDLYPIDRKIGAIVSSSGALQAELDYTKNLNNLEADLKTLELRLQLLEQKESQRYITAGIDGVVSYIASIKPGDLCGRNSAVFSVDSGSASVFAATGSNVSLLSPGMEVNITVNSVNDETYLARVSDPADLGITEPQTNAVYMALVDPVNFPNNSYGSIKLTAEERKDVLYVPSDAVTTVRDRTFVYLLTDNIKTIKDVTIGLDTGYFTEITGGLSEGDEILVGGNR